MMERLEHGDFYILCPDNEANRAMDERRILWPPAISSRIARRCRGGTPTTRTASRPSSTAGDPSPPGPRVSETVKTIRLERRHGITR